MKNFSDIQFEDFNQIGNIGETFKLLTKEICQRYRRGNIEFCQDISTEQSIAQLRMIMYSNDYEWLLKHPTNCLCMNITYMNGSYVIYKYCGLNRFRYFQSSGKFMLQEIPRYNELLKNYVNEMEKSNSIKSLCKSSKKYGLFYLNDEDCAINIVKNTYFDDLPKDSDFPEIFNSMKDNSFQITFNRKDFIWLCNITDFTYYCKSCF